MKIYKNNSIDIEQLTDLFTESFSSLRGNDGEKFGEGESQEFHEWFGIEYLPDYLKFSHVILAEEEGKLVGGAIVGMQNPLAWPDGKKYELFILGVLPEYRSKGVGRELMAEVEKVAKENGAISVILNTHKLMTHTQKFYTDLGYRIMGELEGYYGNGNAVFMMKTL